MNKYFDINNVPQEVVIIPLIKYNELQEKLRICDNRDYLINKCNKLVNFYNSVVEELETFYSCDYNTCNKDVFIKHIDQLIKEYQELFKGEE